MLNAPMSNKEFDKIDLDIIRALYKNSRQSITNLAKSVGISRPTTMKRLARMIENNSIGIGTGVNLKKLGFRIGCVGLEVKGAESRMKVQKFLERCPRVLMTLCPFEKISFSVYFFGEDQDTLRSTIYSFTDLPDTTIAYVNYSDPPLYPKTFPLKLVEKKSHTAPCGRTCSECYSYQEELCVGCPAVEEYKGPLQIT
jgi:DNA-binding Lrp family transcriptional regulator